MSSSHELPYDFDLLYDIKYMYEVENVANGNGHSSGATPEELVELFISNNLDVPDCLKAVKAKLDNQQTIWILPDGTWTDYEPLEHEHPTAQKVTISKF